jgi:protease I
MAHIAVIIDTKFEDVEYTQPVQAFKEHGHRVTNVGLKKGSSVTGKKEGTEVRIDKGVAEATVDEFDALLIPGGYSPDHLRVDEDAVAFSAEFVASGKPVFTICHGPQVLITADVLRDRTVTGYRSIIRDITNAGAHFKDAEVVEDDNLISSRNPHDLPAFIDAALKKLGS